MAGNSLHNTYCTLSGIMTDSPDPYTPPLLHDVVGDELLGGGPRSWHSPEQWLNTDENQQHRIHIQSCNRTTCIMVMLIKD